MDSGIYNGTWQYNDLMGFRNGKFYTFRIDKRANEAYNITELTEDLFIQLSSEISINQHFKDIKKED